MDKVFRSVFAPYIESLIKLKRNLGYSYISSSYQLARLDQFAYSLGEKGPSVTQEFAAKWLQKQPNETASTHYYRALYLVTLSSHISDLGINSFIPRLPKTPTYNFVAFIYSEKEIERFFKVSDSLEFKALGSNVVLFCFPLLMRFLYGTGIRIGEAFSLLEEDVKIDARYIKIKDSKNGKERIVPITKSLARNCEIYLEYKQKLPGEIKGLNYFFVGKQKKQVKKTSVFLWFKKCIYLLKMSEEGFSGFPRIHDFRHTFAIHALTKMANDGIDLYTSLPILSTYLGHTSITATEKYVRLTSKMYPDIIYDLDASFLDVFPKPKNYETH